MTANAQPTPNPDRNLSNSERRVIRDKIRHENELLNHRITWMALYHGLLLNAVSAMWRADEWLLVGIAGFGIILSATGFFSLWLSRMALKHQLSALPKNMRLDDPITGVLGFDLLNAYGTWGGYLLFVLPWFVLPLITLTGWTLIFVRILIVKF